MTSPDDRISPDRLLERISAARALVAAAGASALVLHGRPASMGGGGVVRHLVGWSPGDSACALILPAAGEPLVLSRGPNTTRVFGTRLAGIGRAVAYRDSADLARRLVEALAAVAGRGPVATCAEGEMGATVATALAAAFPRRIPLDGPLHDMRLVRHADEVALHRRAAAISAAMIDAAVEAFSRPGATPTDIMVEAECRGRCMGADHARLWIAVDERPATTYFELCELKDAIGPRDRLQLGTTVQYEGHFAQCLRTAVRGEPSADLLDCTRRLMEMQDEALSTLVPGAPLSRLVDVLEAGIDAACPYTRASDPFRFQSCHALGVDYVEPACAAALDPARDRSVAGPPVAENMVIEIHPNFTLPSLGHVCIGDMALVTADGAEWISAHPRGLIRV